jgi:hypothetical protein
MKPNSTMENLGPFIFYFERRKTVPLLSTICDNSMTTADRWKSEKNEKEKIPIPNLFANYRNFMGEWIVLMHPQVIRISISRLKFVFARICRFS